jgi:Ca2+-binding RTX toxin-like protein
VLTGDQIAAIKPSSLKGLTTNTLPALSSSAVSQLTTANLSALTASSQLEALTQTQVAKLNSDAIDWLYSKGYTTLVGSNNTTSGIETSALVTAPTASTITSGKTAVKITGSTGADIITGSPGADTLDGGTDSDSIFGNSGNDIIKFSEASDTIDGGEGNDTLLVTLNCSDMADSLLLNVENISINGSSSLTVSFANQSEALTIIATGTAGYSITGGSGSDKITGTNSDDKIDGSLGNDTLTGGSGNDILTGSSGDDSFIIDLGTDTITDWGTGTDTLTINALATAKISIPSTGGLVSTFESITNQGTLSVDGSSTTAAVTITASTGNDSISGGADADVLTGGSGKDTLLGGGGSDSISGGAGHDLLTGGDGIDKFIFSNYATNGIDTITDFTTTTDKLLFNAVDTGMATSGTLIAAGTQTALVNHSVAIVTTSGAAANLTTGGTAVLVGTDLLATSLTKVASYLSERFSVTAASNAVFVLNSSISDATGAYVYNFHNGSDTTLDASDLTLIGVITGTVVADDIA